MSFQVATRLYLDGFVRSVATSEIGSRSGSQGSSPKTPEVPRRKPAPPLPETPRSHNQEAPRSHNQETPRSHYQEGYHPEDHDFDYGYPLFVPDTPVRTPSGNVASNPRRRPENYLRKIPSNEYLAPVSYAQNPPPQYLEPVPYARNFHIQDDLEGDYDQMNFLGQPQLPTGDIGGLPMPTDFEEYEDDESFGFDNEFSPADNLPSRGLYEYNDLDGGGFRSPLRVTSPNGSASSSLSRRSEREREYFF